MAGKLLLAALARQRHADLPANAKKKPSVFMRGLHDRILLVSAMAPPAVPAGTPPWGRVADLQTALDRAIGMGKPVFVLPCVIETAAVTLSPVAGGNRIEVAAEPGTVVWSLNAPARHLLRVQSGMAETTFRGLVFDGNRQALTEASIVAGLVRLDGAGYLIDDCEVRNSAKCGIAMSNEAHGTVRACRIHACDVGVWSLDSQSVIENCRIARCANNGVAIWRSSVAADNSTVSGNHIEDIDNVSVGTGQYGNGVSVFRAGNVEVLSNDVSRCRFSGIRVNGGSHAQITANTCSDIREVAIFVESPNAGIDTADVVVANNTIRKAGLGISVVNAGLFSDGVTRRVVVRGNHIENVTFNAIAEGGYVPPQTLGIGIVCETETQVIDNFIDNTAGAGIVLGTNAAAHKLLASRNIVRHSPLSIGFSADPAAAELAIDDNLAFGYRDASPQSPDYPLSGALVPVAFDGKNYHRVSTDTMDYGNVAVAHVGAATLSANRATP
jgi:uncharacterized secreted repeat protein (TIGR03808 family)